MYSVDHMNYFERRVLNMTEYIFKYIEYCILFILTQNAYLYTSRIITYAVYFLISQ